MVVGTGCFLQSSADSSERSAESPKLHISRPYIVICQGTQASTPQGALLLGHYALLAHIMRAACDASMCKASLRVKAGTMRTEM